MKKVVFVVLLLGAAAINPEARARSLPYAQAVAEHLPVAGPARASAFLDPVFRWSARNEMRSIVRDLQQDQNTARRLPTPKRFHEYLRESHVSGRTGVDPWGGAYYLRVRRDSVIVGSPGPDRLPETADDLHHGWARR